jgi:redox-sensing transcriptional repressor
LNNISQPTINRLCTLFQILVEMENAGVVTISSSELGEKVGIGSHNVRKDISCMGGIGSSGAGYEVAKLKNAIALKFGFTDQKLTCIVGLGRIGTALLQHAQNTQGEFRIVAGFDSNINKLETIKTTVSVFPAHQIPEIIRKMGIELGILAVPETAAQEAAGRLIDGGIRGIINFTATHISVLGKKVFVKNIDITGELRILSALIKIDSIG